MTYETYQLIHTLSLIMAGVMLVVSVILFFFLHIPKSFGVITGFSAKKAIKSINSRTEQSASERLVSGKGKKAGKKYADDLYTPSGRIQPKTVISLDENVPVTSKIATDQIAKTAANSTTVLSGSETTVLDTDPTANIHATTLLPQPPFDSSTTVLSGNETTVLQQPPTGTAAVQSKFVIEVDITFIHTNEII